MGIDETHWLHRVRRRHSPHFDARSDPEDIALVVIHNISLPPGRFGGGEIEALFCGTLDCTADPALKDLESVEVSSHLLIDRRGRCTQFVPFDARAWHAGSSCWQGRSRCNDFAIGIELEGTDDRPYTKAQYQTLKRIAGKLLDRYPRLHPGSFVGHNEIAPGRKTDPGPAFDWPGFLQGL